MRRASIFLGTRFGDNALNIGTGIAVDTTGNIAVSGTYLGSFNFGCGALPNAMNNSLLGFVTLFDTNGACVHQTPIGGGNIFPFSLKFLTEPDFVVVGSFGGSVNFPKAMLTENNNGDGFVARLEP